MSKGRKVWTTLASIAALPSAHPALARSHIRIETDRICDRELRE